MSIDRVTHLLEQMHRSEDDGGDPIATGKHLVTDGARGFTWEDAAAAGLGWFNIEDYGAVGDGTTDNQSAINAAIAALNSAGRGVLYVPAGDFLTSGALTAITVPCLILGDGHAGGGVSFSTYVSRIKCSSATAVLFDIQTHAYAFDNIALMNSNATPSAGAGIAITANGDHGRFSNVTVEGFYIDIDIQEGAEWRMDGCHLLGPVLYGLKVRHIDLPDAGDFAVSDSWFTADARNATAAIRWESGGGGKFVNCKINKRTNTFTDGIQLNINGAANSTSVMTVAGCSFENMTGDAIDISTTGTGRFALISISGNQFGLYSNNTGRCVKITAASTGGFVNGGIGDVVIDGLVARTDGTARAAVELTNTDKVTLGEMSLDGFDARYTSSGDTNTIDQTTLDFGEAGDIQPVGTTASAGSTGEVADAGHVHTISEDAVEAAGHWEVIVSGSAPPVAVTNPAEDDWLYGWVPG